MKQTTSTETESLSFKVLFYTNLLILGLCEICLIA